MRKVGIHQSTPLMLMAAALSLVPACMLQPSRSDIQSPDASTRARAIQAAADRRDEQAIPLLVDRLEDEDQSVRFFAILALEHMTGQRMGYLYYRAPGTQSDAIRRWRGFAENRDDRVRFSAPQTQVPAPASNTAALRP